jgi:hypothetical protein
MVLTDDMFDEVVLDSQESNVCSPEVYDPEFFGIMINAPKIVTFDKSAQEDTGGGFARIPICGFYMLDGLTFEKYARVIAAMEIVATDIMRSAVYTGRVAGLASRIPKEHHRLTPEQLADMAIGGFFNPNLAERVMLPPKAATYDVHVELGKKDTEEFIQSNSVTVQIVEQQKRGQVFL